MKYIYTKGYTRFSEIRAVELESSIIPKFSIYPNPSNGIVGIKFDNIPGGQMLVQVFNTHGQTVMKKEISTMGLSLLADGSFTTGSVLAKNDRFEEPGVLYQSTYH